VLSVALADAEVASTKRPTPALVSTAEAAAVESADNSSERALSVTPSAMVANVRPVVEALTLMIRSPSPATLTPVLEAVALWLPMAFASIAASGACTLAEAPKET
jgi:hypothetical protein